MRIEITVGMLLIVVCAAVAALVPAGPAAAETWIGMGATDLWTAPGNWDTSFVPANPSTEIITFEDADAVTDATVTNIVDEDWTIGGLNYANMLAGGHNTHISAGKTLVVDGDLQAWYNIGADHSLYTGMKATITGGTLQVGTDVQTRDLFVAYVPGAGWRGVRGTMTMACGGIKTHLRNVVIGASDANHNDVRPGWGHLDLRGTPIVGGTFSAGDVTVGKGSAHIGAVYLDDACGLQNLSVSGTLAIGTYGSTGSLGVSENDWKLPSNVNVSIGVDASTRGSLILGTAGESQGHNSGYTGTGTLVADDGGTFTAYLTNMFVGYSTQFNFSGAVGAGTLDISAMDSVTLDVSGTATIGESTTENGRFDAVVKLPAGVAAAASLNVGVGGSGARSGLLSLHGTVFTVNSSLTVGPSGTVRANVSGVSCGLDLAESVAVTVGEGGVIDVVFDDTAPPSGIYWGLRAEGDRLSEFEGLYNDGKLTWDDTLLGLATGETVTIFKDAIHTYVGLNTFSLDGDVNGDCVVNILDLIGIRNHLNQDANSPPENKAYDVNDDDSINILDMIYVRNRLNTSCPEL